MPRFDTESPAHVDVSLAGDIHVITGERSGAAVVVNPADPERAKDVEAAEQTEVELSDGTLAVRATEGRRLANLILGPKRPGAVSIVLEVPEGVGLTVAAQIANVRADGRLGRTEVRTQVGSIHLDRTGDVTARTSGGDVTIRQVDGGARVQGMGSIHLGSVTGPATVKNHTGPVTVESARGSLRLRSSTGDLHVGVAGSDVAARTSGGSITVEAATTGVLDLRTAGGTIRVGVREGTSVLLDAVTKLGRIDQQLDTVTSPAPSDHRAEIRAHTAMGDVVVHRA